MSASHVKASIDVVTAATQFMTEQLDKYEGARKDVLKTVSTQNNSAALLLAGRGLLWGSLIVIALIGVAVWVSGQAEDEGGRQRQDVSGAKVLDVSGTTRSARIVSRAMIVVCFVLAAVLVTVFFVTSHFAQSDVNNMSRFVTFKLGDILYRTFADAPDRIPTEIREARRRSGAKSELSDDRKAMLRNYMTLAFSSNDFGSNITDFTKIYATTDIPHLIKSAEKARSSMTLFLSGAALVLCGSAAFAAFYDDRTAADAAQRQLKSIAERLPEGTGPAVIKVLQDEWKAREDVVARETGVVRVAMFAALGSAIAFGLLMATLYYRYYRVLYKKVPRLYSDASDAWGTVIDTMRELDKQGKNPLAPGSTMAPPRQSAPTATSSPAAVSAEYARGIKDAMASMHMGRTVPGF